MEQIKLAAKPREAIGTKSVKRLRDEGKIPGVVYGRAFGEAVAIVIESRDLRVALSHGAHSVINLEIEGRGPTPVLLHDRQLDPVTKRLLHVDLHAVANGHPRTFGRHRSEHVRVDVVGDDVLQEDHDQEQDDW